MIGFYLQLLIEGLAKGLVYAMLTLPLYLVFYTGGVVNLAGGAIAVAVTVFVSVLAEQGVPPLLLAVLGVVAAGILGYRATSRLVGSSVDPDPSTSTLVLVAMGVIALNAVVLMVGWESFSSVPILEDRPFVVDFMGDALYLPLGTLLTIAVAATVLLVTYYEHRRSGLNEVAARRAWAASFVAFAVAGGIQTQVGFWFGGLGAWTPVAAFALLAFALPLWAMLAVAVGFGIVQQFAALESLALPQETILILPLLALWLRRATIHFEYSTHVSRLTERFVTPEPSPFVSRLAGLRRRTWIAGAIVVIYALIMIDGRYLFQVTLGNAIALGIAATGIGVLARGCGQITFAAPAYMFIGAALAVSLNQSAAMPFALAAICALVCAAVIAVLLSQLEKGIKNYFISLSGMAIIGVVALGSGNFWFGDFTDGVFVDTGNPEDNVLVAIGLAAAVVYARYRFEQWQGTELVVGSFVRIGHRAVAQALSAALLALSGVVLILIQGGYWDPYGFSWERSFQVLLIAVIGGLGSVFGGFVGALAYVLVGALVWGALQALDPFGSALWQTASNLQTIALGALALYVLTRTPDTVPVGTAVQAPGFVPRLRL